MSTDRRLIAGVVALGVIVAACGGSGSKTAAPTDAGNGGTGNNPTSQPTSQPTDGGNGGSTSQPTDAGFSLLPGNATDLAKMIPDKVGGVDITKTSFDYSTIPWASLGGGGDGTGIEKTLKDNGKTLADIAFAMGIAKTPSTTGLPTIIYALQVKGLDASKFVDGFDSSYATNPELTAGGKKVHGAITSGFANVTYLHNDVVFMIIASEKDLNDIVSALP